MSGDARQLLARIVRAAVDHRAEGRRELADALGLSLHGFNARLRGRVWFKPHELNALLRLVPDQRLVDHLLAGTTFIGVPRPAPPSRPGSGEDLRDSAFALARESVELCQLVVRSLDGAEAADEAADDIASRIRDAERALAALRARVERRETFAGHRDSQAPAPRPGTAHAGH